MGETWNGNNGTYVRIFLNAERDNYGCAMVNESIYVLSGKYEYSGIEGRLIEKCDLDTNGSGYDCSCNWRSYLQLTS